MTLSNHYDAIVVGLGALGAATLYQLSQRGARVLGIDQFAPPHDQGSSHGDSRITRLAVGEGDEYVPFVQRSHAIWRELEARTGKPLMTTTGGLVLAPQGRVAEHHGKPDFVRRTIACAQRFGIAHALLDAPAIRARFPQFALQGDELGYFEPEAGFVRPEEAIAAQLEAAVASGAVVPSDVAVASFRRRCRRARSTPMAPSCSQPPSTRRDRTTNSGPSGSARRACSAPPTIPEVKYWFSQKIRRRARPTASTYI